MNEADQNCSSELALCDYSGSVVHFAIEPIYFTILILVNLINSRVGRSLRALHGNEEAADAMGVNTARLKLNVFIQCGSAVTVF